MLSKCGKHITVMNVPLNKHQKCTFLAYYEDTLSKTVGRLLCGMSVVMLQHTGLHELSIISSYCVCSYVLNYSL